MKPYEELLFDIANCQNALNQLPENVQNQILKFKSEYEEKVHQQELVKKKALEEERKRNEKFKQDRIKLENELLCVGTWAEKLDLHDRFVLCERIGKHFVGLPWELDESKQWETETEYCAIDLVRGFKSPYWRYWSTPDKFYFERMKPIFTSTSKRQLVDVINSEWNFFNVADHPEDKKIAFHILNYVENKDGIHIVGKTKAKTFDEHQADLKKNGKVVF